MKYKNNNKYIDMINKSKYDVWIYIIRFILIVFREEQTMSEFQYKSHHVIFLILCRNNINLILYTRLISFLTLTNTRKPRKWIQHFYISFVDLSYLLVISFFTCTPPQVFCFFINVNSKTLMVTPTLTLS